MNIYKDSNNVYYCPAGTDSPDTVTARSASFYTALNIPAATQATNIGTVWSLVPAITDLGLMCFGPDGVGSMPIAE